MPRTALVTGATGQDGHYLVALLRERGYVVHAQSRSPQDATADPSLRWHVGDLTDASFRDDLIASTRPDELYNLAAVSRPTASWTLPRDTAEVTAFLPHAICELLLKHRPDCRMFQASSSDMFADEAGVSQHEASPCEPVSPYGAAKLYAHRIVGAYRRHHGLHACCGIMFNHESPRRPLSFVSQKIAHAAAAASLGVMTSSELDERGRPILHEGRLLLGDLDVRRDFGFAGDYAVAMHMILQHAVADDYVVGTGEDHSIGEFCDLAFRAVGLVWTDHVGVDPDLIRRTDSRFTRADARKLRSVINWSPVVRFHELVTMMVHAQRAMLQRVLGRAASSAETA